MRVRWWIPLGLALLAVTVLMVIQSGSGSPHSPDVVENKSDLSEATDPEPPKPKAQVVAPRFTGTVTHYETGEAISGAEVAVYRSPFDPLAEPIFRNKTDAEGRFEKERFHKTVTLRVAAPGFVPFQASAMDLRKKSSKFYPRFSRPSAHSKGQPGVVRHRKQEVSIFLPGSRDRKLLRR